jgi:hypothetical protein
MGMSYATGGAGGWQLIDLGLALDAVLPWFPNASGNGYTRISVPADHAALWPQALADAVRRAYIADHRLEELAARNGMSKAEVLASKLPDPGSVMSGDFGEITAYIYLASNVGTGVLGPKRWRLKYDRTKSAPGSDIVQLLMPAWPTASEGDSIICAEVKAKATAGNFDPIGKAIEGMTTDRTSRLAKTLVWLRERAIADDIGAVTIPQLNRFINATEFPPYSRAFHAIAVVCTTLVGQELRKFIMPTLPPCCALVIMDVPNLHETYSSVYEAAHASVVVDGLGEVTES